MSAALDNLLQRCLPPEVFASIADAPANVTVRGAGVEFGAAVTGLGAQLLQVAHDPGMAGTLLPLVRAFVGIVLDDGAIRIDVPVQVTSCGRSSLVLRMMAPPLVLRRRMVRDHKLREALDVPRPDQAPAAA